MVRRWLYFSLALVGGSYVACQTDSRSVLRLFRAVRALAGHVQCEARSEAMPQ